MKKLIYSLIITAIFFLGLHTSIVMAQGSLEFNQVKLISNSVETVPVGKVWKVTSIYGQDLVCLQNDVKYSTSPNFSRGVGFVGAGIEINGSEIFSSRVWSSTNGSNIVVYIDNTCESIQGLWERGWASFDIEPNPNIIPLWLPENTTLKTFTENIFTSVIEFNVIP